MPSTWQHYPRETAGPVPVPLLDTTTDPATDLHDFPAVIVKLDVRPPDIGDPGWTETADDDNGVPGIAVTDHDPGMYDLYVEVNGRVRLFDRFCLD